jgi:hypothetical protein
MLFHPLICAAVGHFSGGTRFVSSSCKRVPAIALFFPNMLRQVAFWTDFLPTTGWLWCIWFGRRQIRLGLPELYLVFVVGLLDRTLRVNPCSRIAGTTANRAEVGLGRMKDRFRLLG